MFSTKTQAIWQTLLSNNSELGNFDAEDSYQPGLDDFELTCDALGKVPLHHSVHSFIKQTSNYENHVTDETKTCTHRRLTNFLGSVVNTPSTLLNDNSSKHKDNVQKSNHEENSELSLKWLCPCHDKRKRDKILKSFWEV